MRVTHALGALNVEFVCVGTSFISQGGCAHSVAETMRAEPIPYGRVSGCKTALRAL